MTEIDVESLSGRRNDERWNRMVVGDVLERMASGDATATALVAVDDAVQDPRYASVTYAEADEIANRMANALLGMGLARSDRVAILAENSVEAYLTKMAIAKAGLVAVPINVMMAPDVVGYMLELVGAEVAVVEAGLWPRRRAPFDAASVRPVVVIGEPVPELAGVPRFHDVVSAAPPVAPELRLHADDVWEILPTSGTTAMPKAVMISHTYSYTAAMSHALSYTRNLDREHEIRLCTLLPMIYHIGHHAYVLSCLLSGGTAILGRQPSGRHMAEVVTAHRATVLWGGSPQILRDVVLAVDADPGSYDLSSLRVVVYGWNAMSPGLKDDLTRLAGGSLEPIGIFGQTEAIACHRFWPNRWPDVHARTAPQENYVGLPTPLLAARTVPVGDPVDGAHADDEGTGEAVYRSPAIFSGYYRDERATAEALRDGWFHSGDLCRAGEDGLRVMVDRAKDVIKSGGENVSSVRVEAVLSEHPAVSRVAIVGLPDGRWGEAVTAVVVPREGHLLDPDELIAFARERLAGFETPKRIVVAAELPTTVGGKILKYRLRRELATGLTP